MSGSSTDQLINSAQHACHLNSTGILSLMKLQISHSYEIVSAKKQILIHDSIIVLAWIYSQEIAQSAAACQNLGHLESPVLCLRLPHEHQTGASLIAPLFPCACLHVCPFTVQFASKSLDKMSTKPPSRVIFVGNIPYGMLSRATDSRLQLAVPTPRLCAFEI